MQKGGIPMSVHTVQYEGIEIEYELTRKNVKYINLRVNKHGKVVVSAGERVPFSVIAEFVQSKAFWIITHLAQIEQLKQEAAKSGLHDGKIVYYLGKPYQFLPEEGENHVSFVGDTLHFSSPHPHGEELREDYLAWLKQEAEQKFAEIMDKIYPLVQEYGIEKPEIKIRNMRSRWGSCTTAGHAIRLNLQLMKADEDCIAQVVLHELLHFLYPNHGKEFYALLGRLMPDWQERKERLEKNFQDGI